MASDNNWPDFKSKAHNTLVSLQWLYDWTLRNPSTLGNYYKLIDTAVVSHGQYHAIMKRAGQSFSNSESDQFYTSGMMMLRSYSLLSRAAHIDKKARWQIKPKHHHLFHGFLHARKTRRNPRGFWLFRHEDFVGRTTAKGKHIHPSSLSKTLLQVWRLEVGMKVSAGRNAKLLAQYKKRGARLYQGSRLKVTRRRRHWKA